MLHHTVVSPRVRVFSRGGETLRESYGANATAIAGDAGVLLVDPLIAPAEARLVEEAVGNWTLLPVRFVVLTHHHTDHALGAGWWHRRGVPVIAHRACRERMGAEHASLVATRRAVPELRDLFEDAEPYLPPVTFEDGLALDLGGLEAQVLHTGHGHTPGDVVVWIPAEGVAVAGDLVSSGYHVNLEDAALGELAHGLERLRRLAPRVVVPGHGVVSGPEEIGRQRVYHDEVARIAGAGVAAGKTDAVIAAEIEARFPDYRLGLVLEKAVARRRAAAAPGSPHTV